MAMTSELRASVSFTNKIVCWLRPEEVSFVMLNPSYCQIQVSASPRITLSKLQTKARLWNNVCLADTQPALVIQLFLSSLICEHTSTSLNRKRQNKAVHVGRVSNFIFHVFVKYRAASARDQSKHKSWAKTINLNINLA